MIGNETKELLKQLGQSFMLPVSLMAAAGLLLGIGSAFTNQVTVESYGLGSQMAEGTPLHALFTVLYNVGKTIFGNLPLIFAAGVSLGMAREEKGVAALSAVTSYFVMNISINTVLHLKGLLLPDGSPSPSVLPGTIVSCSGIMSLQTGVLGGVMVGLGVAWLHNRYVKIRLPKLLAFFEGTHFVPIVTMFFFTALGVVLTYLWGMLQQGIFALGSLVTQAGYLGTLAFGIIKRALIPLGLHHVFYMPFWQTGVGGTMLVDGQIIEGGQNIFLAQLASPNVLHVSAEATRYFSGEFIFMIFGLPGAALAMYHTAKPEKKKIAGGLLLSGAFVSILTGTTQPIEFSFLFVAPMLYGIHVVLAGSAYMVAQMMDIAVGLTYSGGILDLIVFGILPGYEKTHWLRIIPAGIVYFGLYYTIFRILITKYDFKTPGREDNP